MVADAIRTARAAGSSGQVLVRGDSAYGTSVVANACLRAGARFSLVLVKSRPVAQAIASIDEHVWTPVHYPGAVEDPDTGQLISDAHVAEVQFAAFASSKTPVTARLIVRRVRDRAKTDELVPVWHHHPFLTDSDEPTAAADLTHRRHAIIETVHSDLIDGPLASMPSGRFAANSAWAICAMITHNLLHAAGTVVGGRHALARGATLRRHLVAVPARIARPARRVLHLPAHWPWAQHWSALWTSCRRPTRRDLNTPIRRTGTTATDVERWADQPIYAAHNPHQDQQHELRSRLRSVHGSRLGPGYSGVTEVDLVAVG